MRCLNRLKYLPLMVVFYYPMAIEADPAIAIVQQVLIFDYNRGMRFTFKLNQNVLNKTNWPNGMQAPSLAPKQAVAIARRQLATLISDPSNYEVKTIALEKIDDSDDWYYEVDFSDRTFDPANNNRTEVPIFEVPVLLDGSTINPRVDKAAPYDTSGIEP